MDARTILGTDTSTIPTPQKLATVHMGMSTSLPYMVHLNTFLVFDS